MNSADKEYYNLQYKLCQEFWKKRGRGSLNLYCNGGVASISVKMTFGSRSSADNSPPRKKKPPSKMWKSRLRKEAWLEKRRTENPPAPPAPLKEDVHVIHPTLKTSSIAPDPAEDSGGKEVNQEQTTDSLGERQHENRTRTQNTDWTIDDENWEIHSLAKLLPLNLIATCPEQKYKCTSQLSLSRILDGGRVFHRSDTIRCPSCSTLLCKEIPGDRRNKNVMLNTNYIFNSKSFYGNPIVDLSTCYPEVLVKYASP